MRRRRILAAVAAAAAAALLVPGVLLARVARADVAVEVVPDAAGSVRAIVAAAGAMGRIELAVGPFPPGRDRRFYVRVFVSSNLPTAGFVLKLVNGSGTDLGRCSFAPGGYDVQPYHQTTILTCPAARPEELRAVVLEAVAPESPALVHVSRRPDGRYEAGGMLAGVSRGPAGALERLSAARARGLRAPTLLIALGLSAALLVLALVLAMGRGADAPPRPLG